MEWLTLNNRLKIMQIFKYLIANHVEVKIGLEGEKSDFTSKFIKMNQGDRTLKPEGKTEVIIDKIFPKKGDILIQSYPEIEVEFMIQQRMGNCSLIYTGISSTYPDYGHILLLPEAVEIEEKRKEKRHVYSRPEFISVEFRLDDISKEDDVYKLNVLDCSKYGLGIIIPPKYFELLQKLNIGDELKNITFYATWTMIRVDGTVRHKTKIEEGEYRGCYILGIESPEIIADCIPKNERKQEK